MAFDHMQDGVGSGWRHIEAAASTVVSSVWEAEVGSALCVRRKLVQTNKRFGIGAQSGCRHREKFGGVSRPDFVTKVLRKGRAPRTERALLPS